MVLSVIPEPCPLNSTDAFNQFCQSRKTFWGSLPSQASHCSSQAEPEVLRAAAALSFLQQLPSVAHGIKIGRDYLKNKNKKTTCLTAAELLVHSDHVFKCFPDIRRASSAYYKKQSVSKYHSGPRAQALAATVSVVNTPLGVRNYKWSPRPKHILVSPSGMPLTVASAGRRGEAGHII